MAPFGNTVRLVNGKEREGNALQRLDELRHGKAFRRDIEDLDLVAFELPIQGRHLLRIERAVHERGGYPVLLRRVHLVLHKRDERTDYHGRPLQQKRGQLVAQGLPAARWHDREHVLLVQDGADDRLLVRPE